MIVHKTPFVTSTFEPAPSCVFQVWHGYARSEEFRGATMRVLEFVQQASAEHPRIQFLVDARQLGPLLPEDMAWAAREADPLLYAAGMRKIAFIVPETAIGRTSVKTYQKAAEVISPSPLESRQFSDLASARAWLKS